MPKVGESGAFDRVMRHNMSVGRHPYWHGVGDAALWTVGTGAPLLGTAWMLGGLGGGGGSAGEYDSTGDGIDDTEPASDGAGVGETAPGGGEPLRKKSPFDDDVIITSGMFGDDDDDD